MFQAGWNALQGDVSAPLTRATSNRLAQAPIGPASLEPRLHSRGFPSRVAGSWGLAAHFQSPRLPIWVPRQRWCPERSPQPS